MLGEVLVATALGLVGASLLRIVTAGLSAVVTVCAAGLVGVVALAVAIGGLLVVGTFAAMPVVAAMGGSTVVAWGVIETRRGSLATGATMVAAGAGSAGAITAVLASTVVPILTFDSWRFLEQGASAFGDGAAMDLLLNEFADYPLALASLEGAAIAVGLPFVASAVAAVGLLGVVGGGLLTLPRPARGPRAIAGALAAIALLSASCYVLRVQLGYLNSHLLAAGMYALAVGSALGERVDGTGSAANHRWTVLALACTGLAVTRVEGLLVVALLLVAALTRAHLRRAVLWRLWLVAVGVPAVWYLSLAIRGATGEILTPARMVLLVVIASTPLVVAAVPAARPFRRWLSVATLLTLSAAFGVLAVTSRPTVVASTDAFVSNLLHTGGWGITWWVAVPMLGIALARLADRSDASAWCVITIGFIALVLVLGGVRQNPYRIGWGDSANRIMVHVLPAIALAVVAGLRVSPATKPADDTARAADGN